MGQFPAYHKRNKLASVRFPGLNVSAVLIIPKNDNSVGNFKDLFKFM